MVKFAPVACGKCDVHFLTPLGISQHACTPTNTFNPQNLLFSPTEINYLTTPISSIAGPKGQGNPWDSIEDGQVDTYTGELPYLKNELSSFIKNEENLRNELNAEKTQSQNLRLLTTIAQENNANLNRELEAQKRITTDQERVINQNGEETIKLKKGWRRGA